MYFVYILRSIGQPERIYKGFTQTTVEERLARHNSGDVTHTARYRPWRIIFYSAFEDKLTACRFEQYLKSGSGIVFMSKRLFTP